MEHQEVLNKTPKKVSRKSKAEEDKVKTKKPKLLPTQKNPKVKVETFVEQGLEPSDPDLEKMKERTIKKITTKVKNQTKDLYKQVAEQAAQEARNRVEKELNKEIILERSNLEGNLESEEKPPQIDIEPIERAHLKEERLDESTAVGNQFIVLSQEEYEANSISFYLMGTISGIALSYFSYKIFNWFTRSRAQPSEIDILEDLIQQ